MKTMNELYTASTIAVLSAHITATHRNNKVGQYTNQINRRFYKASTESRRQLSGAITMGLKDEMSQSNLIDAAKKAGKELDVERQTIERRKAPYELYKFCDAKKADNSFYPQEDCPMWTELLANKKKYLQYGQGTMAKLEKQIKNLPTELFFHRTWENKEGNWTFKSELNELGAATLREQDGSMLSSHGTLDLLNERFSYDDFSNEWQKYTDAVDYQGSIGNSIELFRYVPYFVYSYKDAWKGTEKYDEVYNALINFLADMVVNHFGCDRETAIASIVNAAFKYCFTTNPAIYEDIKFARTSEILILACMSRWEENQMANGEAAMNADYTMPEVFDFEDIKDEDEDFEDELL